MIHYMQVQYTVRIRENPTETKGKSPPLDGPVVFVIVFLLNANKKLYVLYKMKTQQ